MIIWLMRNANPHTNISLIQFKFQYIHKAMLNSQKIGSEYARTGISCVTETACFIRIKISGQKTTPLLFRKDEMSANLVADGYKFWIHTNLYYTWMLYTIVHQCYQDAQHWMFNESYTLHAIAYTYECMWKLRQWHVASNW